MSDFYILIAENAGLDLDDPATMDKVASALEALPRDLSVIDAFDDAVDALIA